MRMFSAAFILAAGLWLAPAQAGEAEISAAQSTIAGQLQAFLADDGVGAYAFAAPSIKRMFPTVQSFMSMVENGYAPVRRPRNYAFGKSEERGDTVIQQVLLVGPDGKDYEAVYTVERQPDGTFRITGCSLRASNALST
jgi:hypothetical protein